MGCLPKALMYPVSPKAQRNRFAHFRAQELFLPVQVPTRRTGHPDILTRLRARAGGAFATDSMILSRLLRRRFSDGGLARTR